MGGFHGPNWESVFVPDSSLIESFARGSAVYLLLVVLFRVVLKRQGGTIGLPDVMLVVLVSECVSNALGADANSVPNGLVAVFALLFWNYVLDYSAYRWAWLRRLLEPMPLELVRDGRLNRANMERERISDDELAAQLRENGVEDVGRVKAAFLEAEGTVSVIPADEHAQKSESAPSTDEEPTDFETAVRQFIVAADRVREAVAWHEKRATDHRDAAKAARAVLARYGVSTRRPHRQNGLHTPIEG